MFSFHDLEKTVDTILYGRHQVWAITKNSDNNSIISFKSLLKAEYKSEGNAVWEAIEQNSFATYNKTTSPREFYFELALQAPNNDFGVALGELEKLKTGTDLFSFITPFNLYSDLTLEGYSTVFEASSSLIIVGLQCKEVKQVQQGYTNVTVDTGMTGTSEGSTQEKEKSRSILVILHGGT